LHSQEVGELVGRRTGPISRGPTTETLGTSGCRSRPLNSGFATGTLGTSQGACGTLNSAGRSSGALDASGGGPSRPLDTPRSGGGSLYVGSPSARAAHRGAAVGLRGSAWGAVPGRPGAATTAALGHRLPIAHGANQGENGEKREG
jgi:hypothetical protein